MAGGTKDIDDPVGLSLTAYRETANEILAILDKGFKYILDITE